MEVLKETFVYKTVQEHKILADVYRYPDDEIRPAIIWLHGGAFIFGTRAWLPHWQLELYLKAGYTVISIDYRLAPESKLPAILEDLKDAYTWVRAEGSDVFKIDPDRIAFIGHSAGGYLTLMAGLLHPRPRALVSFYGYGDLTGSWYAEPDPYYKQMPAVSKEQAFESVGDAPISSTPTNFSPEGRYQFYLYCRQQGLWPREVGGHDPKKELAWFSEYEPLRNITSLYPPTLFLHGEMDTDVPFKQSVVMAQALEHHEIANKIVSDSDWGHMFDLEEEDRAVQKALEQVLMFLGKYQIIG